MNRFDSLYNIYQYYQTNEINVYIMGIGQNNSIPVDQITAGNNLPWTKEAAGCNVWSEWDAQNRDLFIMNRENEIVTKINLSTGIDETNIKFIINGL